MNLKQMFRQYSRLINGPKLFCSISIPESDFDCFAFHFQYPETQDLFNFVRNPKTIVNVLVERILFQTFQFKFEGIWLVGCFGFNGLLRQYFSLHLAVSQREGEWKLIEERKNIQTTPTRTYCKRSRTPRHWKFTQHHPTTPKFERKHKFNL